MNDKKFIFICGMCSMEGEYLPLAVATYLKGLTYKYDVDFIFKVSFDKANRTSLNSYRGLGIKKGIEVLKNIKKQVKCKLLTDIHSPEQANMIKDIVDVIQIPAFLCRQTDLVLSAGRTGKIVNIKKGQFLAPEDIKHVITKIKSTGNDKIFLTERGTSFGYHNLVVDFRSFSIMKKLGYPVIFDATHSQQMPSLTNETGGSREYTIPMIKAAVAYGVDGLFIETHPNPIKAKSDSATAIELTKIAEILDNIKRLR